MAIIKDKLKEQVVLQLRNFSNENKPLSSEYFFNHLVGYAGDDVEERDLRFRQFQRVLASTIQEIIIDQMTYQEFVICSCNEGYFIPKSEEGFLKGRNYLISKIDEVHQRIKFIDKMRIKTVYQKGIPQTEDIFSQNVE